MYELIQVGKNSYFVQSPCNVGIVRTNDTDVVLIDSGSDKDAGRRVRQILDDHGWHLTAIFNTHSHADHIGGNPYLQARTGCKIYVPGTDCDFTNHTMLEPAFLYGGFPPEELRNKAWMAQASTAQLLTEASLPEGMSIVPLPGHSFDMVGYQTQDDVIFLADCLSSQKILNKYQVGYIYNVKQYLETLEMVKTLKAALFIPAHVEPLSEIASLAQVNIDQVNEIADVICDICREPVWLEILLQRLCSAYGVAMSFKQYVLMGSTLRSYLSWLKDGGRLTVCFENGQMFWITV
ncbi:MAG: MBL fold metallo-hydrolase [Oscillospiraceae bacterium]